MEVDPVFGSYLELAKRLSKLAASDQQGQTHRFCEANDAIQAASQCCDAEVPLS